MKRPQQTARTLKAIRRLPLEVSFQQVEEWVRKAPRPQVGNPNRWLTTFVARFLYHRSAN